MSRFATLLCLLLLTSCRDEAAEAYARADLKYKDLVAQGAGPDDPRFQAVVAELDKIPASSKYAARADAMKKGLQAMRGAKVRTPLALGPHTNRPPELEAQLAACARLAQLAGADGGVDQRVLRALEDCRFKAEKMELQFSHPEEFGDGGEHHHPEPSPP